MKKAFSPMIVAFLSTCMVQSAFAYSQEEVNAFDDSASAVVETKSAGKQPGLQPDSSKEKDAAKTPPPADAAK